MQFMIVEKFEKPDAAPVYERFREKGRMAPEGLVHVSSWIDRELRCCFQLMQAEDRSLIDLWMTRWEDIVDFEVFEVIGSEDATARAMMRP